ncbi:MAG: hypothetical protein K8S15_12175 [Candidatus Aegiribacteria sp.]|nr:hypothetical protein [Candidatus Aegiribacteria sp.]
MILIGCGADESPPELPDIEYKLVITDSIRVEIGDPDYIFGRPIYMTHSPDGNIMFLDRIKHMAFMYTPEGEFIRSIGREGSGTGEFNLPSSMAFYSNGNLLIGDMDAITSFFKTYRGLILYSLVLPTSLLFSIPASSSFSIRY